MVPEKEFENAPMHKKANAVKLRMEAIAYKFPLIFYFSRGKSAG